MHRLIKIRNDWKQAHDFNCMLYTRDPSEQNERALNLSAEELRRAEADVAAMFSNALLSSPAEDSQGCPVGN